MSRPDPRTFKQLREALHEPAAFPNLDSRSQAFVDAMKAREDAGKAIHPKQEWLMMALALRVGA